MKNKILLLALTIFGSLRAMNMVKTAEQKGSDVASSSALQVAQSQFTLTREGKLTASLFTITDLLKNNRTGATQSDAITLSVDIFEITAKNGAKSYEITNKEGGVASTSHGDYKEIEKEVITRVFDKA